MLALEPGLRLFSESLPWGDEPGGRRSGLTPRRTSGAALVHRLSLPVPIQRGISLGGCRWSIFCNVRLSLSGARLAQDESGFLVEREQQEMVSCVSLHIK